MSLLPYLVCLTISNKTLILDYPLIVFFALPYTVGHTHNSFLRSHCLEFVSKSFLFNGGSEGLNANTRQTNGSCAKEKTLFHLYLIIQYQLNAGYDDELFIVVFLLPELLLHQLLVQRRHSCCCTIINDGCGCTFSHTRKH